MGPAPRDRPEPFEEAAVESGALELPIGEPGLDAPRNHLTGAVAEIDVDPPASLARRHEAPLEDPGAPRIGGQRHPDGRAIGALDATDRPAQARSAVSVGGDEPDDDRGTDRIAVPLHQQPGPAGAGEQAPLGDMSHQLRRKALKERVLERPQPPGLTAPQIEHAPRPVELPGHRNRTAAADGGADAGTPRRVHPGVDGGPRLGDGGIEAGKDPLELAPHRLAGDPAPGQPEELRLRAVPAELQRHRLLEAGRFIHETLPRAAQLHRMEPAHHGRLRIGDPGIHEDGAGHEHQPTRFA